MTSEIRRYGQLALAALLIWSLAGVVGSVGQAADEGAAAVGDPESQAIADRLEAMIERAAAQVGAPDPDEVEEGDEQAARERLEAAETQIRLLKNVVIQALRAQNAAEAALRSERLARHGSAAAEDEAAPDLVGSPDLTLTNQLEALTDSVRRLRADVDELREGPSDEAAADAEGTGLAGEARAALAPDPAEEDAMLPGAGMGGEYQPLIEQDVAAVAPGEGMPTGDDPVELTQVHFNPGSAELTPSGERKALAAAERIRSMGATKVRVVGYADTVGDAAYNLVLSKERALSIAALLESAGLGRDMVEVIGRGEDGGPEPTGDGVSEPLNRCAGIFVVADS